MASVRELLSYVWAHYRVSRAIADDFAIISSIAAILLEKSGLEAPNIRAQAVLSEWAEAGQVLSLLEEAANKAGGVATLLDRHVFFRLPTMLPGGRYPTPRHIVQSMLRLVEVKPHHHLGDFACGSGGFLAYRPKNAGTTAQTVGIEISPEWARLALTNVRLHGLAF